MDEFEGKTGLESQPPEEAPSQVTKDTLSPEEDQETKFETTAKLVISQSPDLGLELGKVVACLKEGIPFGPRRIGPLRQVKQANGDPNVTLDEWLKQAREQIKKKISSLNDLAQKLIEILDIFKRTPKRFEKREREILDNLVSKISELTTETQD